MSCNPDKRFIPVRDWAKKLCRPGTFIKYGEVPGREQAYDREQYEKEDNTDIDIYHGDRRDNQCDNSTDNTHHYQGNNVDHPADFADLGKDLPKIEGFSKTVGPRKSN